MGFNGVVCRARLCRDLLMFMYCFFVSPTADASAEAMFWLTLHVMSGIGSYERPHVMKRMMFVDINYPKTSCPGKFAVKRNDERVR